MIRDLYPAGQLTPPWDDGITWHVEQSADDGPNFDQDPLTVDFIRDLHLRAANGDLEDEYLDFLRKVTYQEAESFTNLALIPQTFRMVLSGFPAWGIYFDRPPLISVDAVEYVDDGGEAQTISGSPAEYDFRTPDGRRPRRGWVSPLSGASWPITRAQSNALVITYTAGYPLVNGVASIPEAITHGRLLLIGELYKQRSESVAGISMSPAFRTARSLWARYKAY